MDNPAKQRIKQEYKQVVAIGGGHGLGRVLSSLSFLGSRLTGIVATTDNGGSTGRLREDQDCIAWGDLRNCLTQLAPKPSIGSLLFEYRFNAESELDGHNLGNLILMALDQLCVRPLEAINLIRGLLKIKSKIIPMSEEPTHLVAHSACGDRVFGELNVDSMSQTPISMTLEPEVEATCEATNVVKNADLIIIGPGSFLTSIMPPLLMPELGKAIQDSNAKLIYIDNIGQEAAPAGNISLEQRIAWCEKLIGLKKIDQIICHESVSCDDERIVRYALKNQFNPALHDKEALIKAIADI
ncbi:uridine diphosphate-N-acetylglucosamine-binding protein YvcK [Shewanella gelidii]|uniref:Putative gluconeogenesis factor n=1 Tax=Shewanella gelidii TaxID=1642821 RepID=A0A917K058_9GAMM|nr:uridine diphosphate-N-acetylglucosamine-binding protein YvcK [Shewanella gelidii]MCL1098108.1 uridine diphosphate-N-acetylglucosamine-binding protein YvcK [Shewanella gelidii]GGI90597.1 putative gluconeogenesis factor [Shewanella gelidii]